jgi:hypothetical protein
MNHSKSLAEIVIYDEVLGKSMQNEFGTTVVTGNLQVAIPGLKNSGSSHRMVSRPDPAKPTDPWLGEHEKIPTAAPIYGSVIKFHSLSTKDPIP